MMCDGGVDADPVDLESSSAPTMAAQHYILEKGELFQQSVGVDGKKDSHGDR
jgi:hypothetical protein